MKSQTESGREDAQKDVLDRLQIATKGTIGIIINKIIATWRVIRSSLPKKLYGDTHSTASAGKSLRTRQRRGEMKRDEIG